MNDGITDQYLEKLRNAAVLLNGREMNPSEKEMWDVLVSPSEVIRLLDEINRIKTQSMQRRHQEAA